MFRNTWRKFWPIRDELTRRQQARRRFLKVEQLEDRRLLAIRTWTGADGDPVNDLWSVAANWDTGVPQNGDDVVIPDVAASDEVLFSSAAADVTLNSLTSAEPFRITGATLTLDGAGTFSMTAGLTLSGGALTGSGTLNVSGASTWTAGEMRGAGTTITAGLLAITASNQSLNQRTLTINGGATLNGVNNLFAGQGATINNNSLFDITTDADLSYSGSGAVPTFNNAAATGILRKSGGTDTSTVGIVLNSAGAVEANSGTLDLSGGGTSTGSFTAAATATLNFSGFSTHDLNAGSSVSGAGTIGVSSGTVNVGGTYNPSGQRR